MSKLAIYYENNPQIPIAEYNTGDAIAFELVRVGIRFERWLAQGEIPANATDEAIIATYQQDIDRLIAETGYQTYDVLSITIFSTQSQRLNESKSRIVNA